MDMANRDRRISRSNLLLEALMAKTAAQRTRERRERMRAAGYRLVQVWLDPDAVEQLEELQDRKPNASKDSLINYAIWLYYKHRIIEDDPDSF